MKKILVIEDDENIRMNIYDLLILNEYRVFTASNGAEGLKLVENENPDLIICDIMMPKISGFDVKKTLAQNNKTKFIPFIFLTAKSEIDNIRTGMNLGADDYIIKPFVNSDLLSSIKLRFEKLNSQTAALQIENNVSKILVEKKGESYLINYSQIHYIESNGNYSFIFISETEKYIVKKNLKQWEEFLSPNKFVRIHQSYIINIDKIIKFEKLSNRTYLVFLEGIPKHFTVSQRFTKKIKKIFSL